MTGSFACTAMGSVLILAGIAMVIFQMGKTSWSRPASRSANIGPRGITLKTTYPGIILIGIGAVMVMAGAATSK
jgi:formate hydrogenlyase subunit 3/multisubunit Na+/H+ antiporter MnhD subunit